MPLSADRPRLIAWLAAAALFTIVMQVRLLPALLAGLLVHELVQILAPRLARRTPSPRG